MPYTLKRLAAGSYDLILDGRVVGSVVQEVTAGGDAQGWRAELLSDRTPLPTPFTDDTHAFGSRAGAVRWLGGTVVFEEG